MLKYLCNYSWKFYAILHILATFLIISIEKNGLIFISLKKLDVHDTTICKNCLYLEESHMVVWIYWVIPRMRKFYHSAIWNVINSFGKFRWLIMRTREKQVVRMVFPLLIPGRIMLKLSQKLYWPRAGEHLLG